MLFLQIFAANLVVILFIIGEKRFGTADNAGPGHFGFGTLMSNGESVVSTTKGVVEID